MNRLRNLAEGSFTLNVLESHKTDAQCFEDARAQVSELLASKDLEIRSLQNELERFKEDLHDNIQLAENY